MKARPPLTDSLQNQNRRQFVGKSVAGITALPVIAPLAGCASTDGVQGKARQRFEFAVMGDMPYTAKQELEFDRLLNDINQRDPAFVVHLGDMMFDPRPYERNPRLAREPMSDDNYRYMLSAFQRVRHPLILTPGDNDWSDAVEFKQKNVDPLGRLAMVRTTFYPDGHSLGQRRLPLLSQRGDKTHGEYVENLTWTVGGVRFATLHITGSNDNAGRTPALEEERLKRKAANLAWMDNAFRLAKSEQALGLVIITHANPGFENRWPSSYLDRYFRMFGDVNAPQPRPASPFDDYMAHLSRHMEDFSRPTLFMHGDTHLFRIDKPLFSEKTKRPFEHFTRVETFGWPDTHWIRVTVDSASPQLFVCDPMMVEGNRLHHL